MVAWMSGLVSGLQNRARRFESACDLRKGYVQIEHILFYFSPQSVFRSTLLDFLTLIR